MNGVADLVSPGPVAWGQWSEGGSAHLCPCGWGVGGVKGCEGAAPHLVSGYFQGESWFFPTGAGSGLTTSASHHGAMRKQHIPSVVACSGRWGRQPGTGRMQALIPWAPWSLQPYSFPRRDGVAASPSCPCPLPHMWPNQSPGCPRPPPWVSPFCPVPARTSPSAAA